MCKIHNREAQMSPRRPLRMLVVVTWSRMAAKE